VSDAAAVIERLQELNPGLSIGQVLDYLIEQAVAGGR